MGNDVDSALLLDRYVIQETLGQGASAVVNLAWDTRIQRNVAIKRIPLPKHSSESSIPGLEEARTGAQLSDSRIVNVIDFEVVDDEALLIMEFVDGISLGDLMDRIPRMLNIDEVASIVQNVGKALQHAHRNHVLHLDIKPDNILIDLTGLSKVTDFGVGRLAKAAGFGNATGGTIGYMPPEQINGEEVSEKTDQWAFAAMIYELLVGENPFISDTFQGSLDLISGSEITLPSSIDDEIDPEVDDIIFRALSIDPAKRYPSVGKFVTELLGHLGNPKEGRTRLGKLVGLFGDEIALGSPEDRMRALKRIERPDTTQLYPPLSEDDDEFYDYEPEQLTIWDEEAADDEEDYREVNPYDERRMVPKRQHRPWRDSVSPHLARIGQRVIGGACNGAIGYIGVFGSLLPWFSTAFPELSAGLPTLPIGIGVVAAIAAIGAIWPRVGSLVSLAAMAGGMLAAGWIPQGAILALIALVWWLFLGRQGDTESNCAVLGPAFGLLGLGYIQPLATGWLLRGPKALFTAMFGVMLQLVIAPATGSVDLYRTTLGFMDHSVANELLSTNVYNSPELWVAVVGWVAAALAMSLLANRGSKVATIAGAVLSGVIIAISRILGGAAVGMYHGLFTVEFLVALVVPVIVMCLAAWLYTPGEADRQT